MTFENGQTDDFASGIWNMKIEAFGEELFELLRHEIFGMHEMVKRFRFEALFGIQNFYDCWVLRKVKQGYPIIIVQKLH